MQEGRIPKDLLFGELQEGTRNEGRPYLRFKDVCKRDMENTGETLSSETWEGEAQDRSNW